MSNPAAIFEIIDKLIAALPLAPPLVSAVLGVGLVRAPQLDTPAIQAYALQAPAAGYSEVDLRMPDAIMGSGSVLLGVTLAGETGLDMTAIVARYGQDFHTKAPSPRYAPGTVPLFVEYEMSWGTLSFSLTADDERRLLGFGLATKP